MSSVMSLPPIESDLQADEHAAGEDRDVGDSAAKLDQGDAELALLVAEAGLARRDRRGDDRLDAEMGGADAEVEILHRRRIGADDVDVDRDLVGMEAERLLDPVDARRSCRAPGWRGGWCGLRDRSIPGPPSSRASISSARDAAAADRDLDPGDVADQPAGGEADEDLVDLGAGDALGLLDRLADRDLALLHVGDEAALDAAALALAGAEDAQLAVLVRLGDQRADLGRADVERGDEVLDG